MPRLGVDGEIETLEYMSTGKNRDWAERKGYALREVFESMSDLIQLAKQPNVWKSLATVKPREIVRFEIQEDERNWKPKFQDDLRQLQLFDSQKEQKSQDFQVVRKLPYKYFYHFLTEGDNSPRRMMIEDWEIGALYWNCLAQTEGDEIAANELVRQKYETEFLNKDLYFFTGTTLAHHMRAPNPFVIIGVFYPPVTQQIPMLF